MNQFASVVMRGILWIAAVLAPGFALAQSLGGDTDPRFHRWVHAAPYSDVSTLTGGLTLTIPLFDIKGPGHTNLSCTLTYRSTVTPGAAPAMTGYHFAPGWAFAEVQYMDRSNNIALWKNGITPPKFYWNVTNIGGTETYARGAAARGTLTSTLNGTSRNYVVVPDRTNTTMSFTRSSGIGSAVYLTTLTDTYGNVVTYEYEQIAGGVYRLRKVTDAVGRFYTIAYSGTVATSTATSVTLTAGTKTRIWSFVYTGTGANARLTKVNFPKPVSSGALPFLEFAYDTAENANTGSVTDLWDFRRSHWHYKYALASSFGANYAPISKVHRPWTGTDPVSSDDPSISYWSADRYTSFAYSATAQFRTCTIGTPAGDDLTDHSPQSVPPYRFQQHIYTVLAQTNKILNPIHQITHWYWPGNSSGEPTSATRWDTYTWDPDQGNLLSFADYSASTWTYTYDSQQFGNEFSKTDPLGKVWNTWWLGDKKIFEQSPELRSTSYFYNAQGDLTETVIDPTSENRGGISYSSPAGKAIEHHVNYWTSGTAKGNVFQVWTENGSNPLASSEIHSSPDAYGYLQVNSSQSGYNVTSDYDELGNELSRTGLWFDVQPSGSETQTTITTSYEYDDWDRLVRTNYHDGSFETKTYDFFDNVIQEKDANGSIKNYLYGALNLLFKTEERVDLQSSGTPDWRYTWLHYDDMLNNRWVQSGSGGNSFNPSGASTTRYEYGVNGNLKRIVYPNSTTRVFAPDQLYRVFSAADGTNAHSETLYNARGDVTQIKLFNSANGLVKTEDFAYDQDGIRTSAAETTGVTTLTTTWVTNKAGQLVSNYQPAPDKTVTYEYDAYGRKAAYTVGSMRVSTKYDGVLGYGEISRPKETRTKLGAGSEKLFAGFTYYDNDLLRTKNLINTQRGRYTYDSKARLLSAFHETGSGQFILNRYQYVYDSAGNVIGQHNYSTNTGQWYTSLAYDRANRLRSEQRYSGPAGNYAFQYTYDKDDNRTQVVRNNDTVVYNYSAFNRLNYGERWNGNLSAGGYVFGSYDGNGNPGRITFPNTTFIGLIYDPREEVTQINYSTGRVVKYAYDFMGRRVKKEDTLGSTQYFVYDGDQVIAETDAAKSITMYYIGDLGTYAANGDRRFYRENAVGSICAISTGGGTKDSETLYDAYGVERYAAGQLNKRGPFRFAGDQGAFSDDETGLVMIGSRLYSPILGRYISADPRNQANGLNLYWFAKNNPHGWRNLSFDPSLRWPASNRGLYQSGP